MWSNARNAALTAAFFVGLGGVAEAAPPVAKDAKGTKEMKRVKAPRAAIDNLATMSTEFAKLTDEVLFNDIWNRPGLSARDKSLITISVLVALGRADQAESHIKLGIDNGLDPKEIESAMLHIAFYAGWPSAVSGLQRYKAVVDQLSDAKK